MTSRTTSGDHESYRIGWVPFLGAHVDLSARPLIPRPETEYWTEKVIVAIRARGAARPQVLDVFCGSGCIGLAVLKHVRVAHVTFADIEKKYFPGIGKSLRATRIVRARARMVRADMFDRLGSAKFDFILANPPYIASHGRYVQHSVLKQEPHNALFAGHDGLRYVRALLRAGKPRLRRGGMMAIEFDSPQKPAIAALARRHGWRAEFHKDQYGRWRFVFLFPITQSD